MSKILDYLNGLEKAINETCDEEFRAEVERIRITPEEAAQYAEIERQIMNDAAEELKAWRERQRDEGEE